MAVNDKTNRLVDYFVICGLDEASGLEIDKLSSLSEENVTCSPLERHYKSKILAHFPETVPWNQFDADAIGMMCLPRGCGFKSQKESRLPNFHSFVITREDGSRTYGSVLVFYEEVTNKSVLESMQTLTTMHRRTILDVDGVSKHCYFNANRDKLFVSKCICLVTPLPFVRCFRQFLMHLYEASTKPALLTLTLESYVFNLIYDVPLPPAGRSLKFYGCSGPICILRPSLSELPLFDYSLYDMFELLSVEIVVDVFKCVLLEHQILLYSSDYHHLMLVAEGMNTLAFPFMWQLVYVPILPASMQHFLDAPVPYIMGLHKGANSDRSSLVLPSEANMCFVDLDKKECEFPEDLPEFPYESELKGELTEVLTKFQNVIGAEKIGKSFSLGPKKELGTKTSSTSSLRSINTSNSPKRKDVLQQSEAWKKISSLAKETGLWDSLEDKIEDIILEDNSASSKTKSQEDISECELPSEPEGMTSAEINDLKFNNTVREIFLNCFVHMFASYENFVINPSQDLESWLSNRESVHSFDKAAFLSDQPASHLPFLSAFIETQMYTTLMDNKIISQWEEAEPNLHLFDSRIRELKDSKDGVSEEPRIITYNPSQRLEQDSQYIEKKAQGMDYLATRPHEIASHISPSQYVAGIFPLLSTELLNSEPANKSKFRENAKWRRKDRQLQHKEHLQSNIEQEQQEK